ncbi:MAG: MCE family protein [Rhodothermales bacterium]|nr:MCE family protein [Rhodothermales bacterium]MBO6779509.1 MCE family protein [Rhodothermales bacterium]
MKYSNELKVGTTIVLATIIFILGVRYFEDLPLFRGTYDLETELTNASGLIAGNTVRVNGVTVGSVDEVYINQETNGVRVLFHVDSGLPIPEGSRTLVSGLDALGVVRMDIELGNPTNPRIEEGGFVPSKESADLIGELSDKAPELLDSVDGVLANLNGVLQESNELLAQPDSDLRQTLVSARRSMTTLDNLLRTQRETIASTLQNVDGATGQLNSFLEQNADSIGAAVSGLSGTLAQVDASLAQLDQTTAGLDELLAKLNSGQGTLGLLINDDSMYRRTDSLLTTLEALVADFQVNPGKYLKELRLVDVF